MAAFEFGGGPPVEDHVGSVGGELVREGKADAVGCAGYEGPGGLVGGGLADVFGEAGGVEVVD